MFNACPGTQSGARPELRWHLNSYQMSTLFHGRDHIRIPVKNIVKNVVRSIVILWKFKLEGLSVEFQVHWRCTRTCCVWRGHPILQLLLQSHLLTISWSVQSCSCCTNLNLVVILVQTATAGGAWLVQVTVIPLTSVWVYVRVGALSWVSHVTWLPSSVLHSK